MRAMASMAFTAEWLLWGPEIAGSMHERPASGLAVDYTPVGCRTDGPREMGWELETEGVGLGHPGRRGLTEGTHGSCLIEPHVLVELRRQACLKIVAGQLGLRSVDDADRALEPRGRELLPHRFADGIAQRQEEGRQSRIVAETFVAVGMGGTYRLDLHGSVPLGGGGHRAVIGPEAHQIRFVLVGGAAELANVVLPAPPHLRGRRVPDVRVVLPDDDPAVGAMKREQRLQRVEHVLVAKIPGRDGTIVERSIVALRIGDEAGVLGRVEEALAIALTVFETASQEVAEHGDHLILARTVPVAERGPAVGRRVPLPRRETAVAVSGDPGPRGIRLLEIGDDGCRGRGQAVEIEPVKARVA